MPVPSFREGRGLKPRCNFRRCEAPKSLVHIGTPAVMDQGRMAYTRAWQQKQMKAYVAFTGLRYVSQPLNTGDLLGCRS